MSHKNADELFSPQEQCIVGEQLQRPARTVKATIWKSPATNCVTGGISIAVGISTSREFNDNSDAETCSRKYNRTPVKFDKDDGVDVASHSCKAVQRTPSRP